MASFDLANPLELVKHLVSDTLGEVATGVQIAGASLSAPFSAGVAGVGFGVSGGAALSVFAYGKGGGDPESVVGPPLPPGGALDALRISPPLAAADGQVYLAYRLEACARASAGAGIGFFGAGAETERKLLLSHYRAHPPDAKVRDALMADALHLHSLLRSEDVAGLPAGDALAMSTSGRVAGSVTVSWSDVLSGVLGRLSQLLPGADHLIAVEAGLGASLHAETSLEDDFVLVFSRPEAGRLRVSLLRAETCSSGAGGALSATVAFDASAPVEAVLGALLGRPLAWVDQTVAQAAQTSLDEGTRNALKWVLDRVGLAGGEADPAGLLERWEQLKERLRGALREAVTARISAGLTYDFQHTQQKQALFQAVFPDAEALARHEDLLRGDLAPVLSALHAAGRPPEVYLRQASVERKHAWGFSLGLIFTSASSTEEDRLRFVTTTRQDGQRRMAALGARSYRGDLFGAPAEWAAELRAEMAGFCPAPKASDFQYGMHLLMHREEKSPGAGVLAQLVDDAV
ncbi:MAG TPA: hypothetical protein VND93_06340, partial [Myxococcales bacterium]|nr:hypothetical protein [Myxococcales bacterium]